MLNGKLIINTRPEGSEDQIGDTLKELGATILQMPLISIDPLPVSQEMINSISANLFQWLVFTSRNGVDMLFNQPGLKERLALLQFKAAVFGERTAFALKEKGFEPFLVNRQNSARDLLNEMVPALRPGDHVLLVLGDLASDLFDEIPGSKAIVRRLNVYRTVPVKSIDPLMLERIAQNNYDLILFTSPSGFQSFRQNTKGIINIKSLKIACLGPTTEKAILEDGILPLVTARPSGKEGMIKEILHFYNKA